MGCVGVKRALTKQRRENRTIRYVQSYSIFMNVFSKSFRFLILSFPPTIASSRQIASKNFKYTGKTL